MHTAFDCNDLPNSMNTDKARQYPKGCPGAVWSSGSPSWSRCIDEDGKYPWWRACCEWKNKTCVPKTDGLGHFYFLDNLDL